MGMPIKPIYQYMGYPISQLAQLMGYPMNTLMGYPMYCISSTWDSPSGWCIS